MATAISINISSWESPPRCVYYSPGDGYFFSLDCQKTSQTDIVCQFDKQNTHSRNEGKVGLITSVSPDLDDTIWKVSMVQCQSGHVTRDFLPCDTQDEYGLNECLTSCHSGIVSIPMFVCEHSHEALHYTLVCDHIRHCEDNTDEDFCLHRACLRLSSFQCQNGQCIAEDQVFDVKSDCYDGSDEVCRTLRETLKLPTLPPAVLSVDGTGKPFLRQMNDLAECPVTHFQCSQGHCLPIYLRCNGVDDCPNREDEASCESYICSGFYRCRRSKVCLHTDNVCDGVFQCPQYDDELLCEKLTCPDVCQCQGLAFVCSANFSASSYPSLRYLDASGSDMI